MKYYQFCDNIYFQFIDHIYHSMDIYRSLIVYNDDNKKNMNDLYNLLLSKDYPVTIINKFCDYDLDSLDRYKMYMIHQDLLEYIDQYCNTSSINVVFCLDDTHLDNKNNKIINTNLNKIFIFSNIK